MKTLPLLAALLLAAGCGFLPGGSERPIDVNYNSVHSGTQGVVLSFVSERPLASYVIVPNGNDITAILTLENRGAWDIPEGKGVLALNYDRTYLSFEQNHKPFDLLGRTLLRPKGEKFPYDFNGRIHPLAELKKDTTLNAVACYEYGTEYIFDVCIDTDPSGSRPIEKACDVLENKKKYGSLSGQGAPVAMTSLDQSIRIREGKLDLDFIIKIRNAGTGKIYDIAATPQLLCLQGGSLELADRVRIQAELAGQVLECDSADPAVPGVVYVREGLEGIVNCRAPQYIATSEPSFLSKLKVSLTYDYVDTVGKGITLKKAGARV